MLGWLVLAAVAAGAVCLLTWSNADPSFTHATSGQARNALGPIGAIVADLAMQLFGLAGPLLILAPLFWGLQLIGNGGLDNWRARLVVAPVAVALLACAASALPKFGTWPLPYNLGGFVGDQGLRFLASVLERFNPARGAQAAGLFYFAGGIALLMRSLGLSRQDLKRIVPRPRPQAVRRTVARWWEQLGDVADRHMPLRREPTLGMPAPGRMDPFFEADTRMHHPIEVYPHPPARDPRDIPRASRPVHRPSPEDAVEGRQAQELAKRFAPEATAAADLDEPFEPALPEAPAEGSSEAHRERAPHAAAGPMREDGDWPPQPERPAVVWPPHRAGNDDLYGRAVNVVLTDRKASNDYLRSRLGIRYMRAQDLLDRMQQEGIVGAPVYNGMRPILIPRPGTQEI